MMFLKNSRMIPFFGKKIILSQNNLLKIPKRNGYLILVPEIGEDLSGKYPLLKEDKSPEFDTVTVEKCIAAIGRQTLEFEDAVKTLGYKLQNVDNISPDFLFKNVMNPIEELCTSLMNTLGIARTLYFGNQTKMPTQYYNSINNRAIKAMNAKYVVKPIYQACKNIVNNKEVKLTDEQRRVLQKYILEGKLNGLELSETEKFKLSELMLLMYTFIKEYSEKVETATGLYSYTIRDRTIVEDLPEEVLKQMVADPSQYKVGPWIMKLNSVVLKEFMEYCSDRSSRYKVWDASVTKNSVFQERVLQASVTLEEIRSKRQQQAEILGYKTYAELSMETKMAGSVENVFSVFDNLLVTARPAQEYEIKELQKLGTERGLEGVLQPWDIDYWGRKQLHSICKHKEETLRNYFPLPKVLSGVFDLIETLFDAKIVEAEKPDVWHKDVRFFHIFDLKESSTNPAGSFYLDPYTREDGKARVLHNNGTMVVVREKSKVNNTKPLIALIFGFQPSTDTKPSLLSLTDLQVLFQNIGGMLIHTLSKVEYAEVVGTTFIEWDAAFVSRYFFENWLYEPFVLKQISGHQETGEPLSTEMIETVKTIRTHLAGYKLCKEMYLSQFDLELYHRPEFWNDIMGRLWKKYFVIPRHKRDCHICSFSDIFSGQLAASYYSMIWSKMLAADLYTAFQSIPPDNKELLKEVGGRYRDTYLALGGSYSANEVFRKFRGRDPSSEALVQMLGLDVKAQMLSTVNEQVEK